MQFDGYSVMQRLFGSDQASERTKQQKMLRAFVGIGGAVCIAYGAYSIPKAAQVRNVAAEEQKPELVILGKEDEETIATTAGEILSADGRVISLDEFLDKKICGSCTRCCLLSGPHCSKGRVKAEKQTAYYEQAVEMIASGAYVEETVLYVGAVGENSIRIGDVVFSWSDGSKI